MNPSPLVVGLGFTRGVGKDTVLSLLNRLDPRFARFSYADPLKADLAPFLLQHFGIDVWRCSAAEKELIRPILIAYGMAQRQRDPDYWVKRTLGNIEQDLSQAAGWTELIPTISDVRFWNEYEIMKRRFPRLKLVYVTRDGAPPPTEEEEKHYHRLIKVADIHFHWGHDDEQSQLAKARGLRDQLLS